MMYHLRLAAPLGWILLLVPIGFTQGEEPVASESGDVRFVTISDEIDPAPCLPEVTDEQRSWAFGGDPCCVEPVYPLRFRGAYSYYGVPHVETKSGGTYGLDTVRQVTNRCGFYGAAKVNHLRAGTQVLVSGGLYKLADPCACSLKDRIGYAAIVDYFEDSRQGDLAFTQLRMQIGVPLNCDWSAGVSYTQPFEDERIPLQFLNNGGVREPTEFVSGYVSGYCGDHLVYLATGYREVSETCYFDASIRTPCCGNLFRFVDTHYEERGRWIVLAGLEFRFGAGCGGDCCWQRNPCSPWDDPTIAEVFNSGEAKTWGRNIDLNDSVEEDEETEID